MYKRIFFSLAMSTVLSNNALAIDNQEIIGRAIPQQGGSGGSGTLLLVGLETKTHNTNELVFTDIGWSYVSANFKPEGSPLSVMINCPAKKFSVFDENNQDGVSRRAYVSGSTFKWTDKEALNMNLYIQPGSEKKIIALFSDVCKYTAQY